MSTGLSGLSRCCRGVYRPCKPNGQVFMVMFWVTFQFQPVRLSYLEFQSSSPFGRVASKFARYASIQVQTMICRPCCGTGRKLITQTPCELCGGDGELPDDPTLNKVCRMCCGNGLEVFSGDFCEKCKGYGMLREISAAPNPEGTLAFFIQSGMPRRAHLGLADLFKELTGEIRICDPYYGMGSLLRLDLLKHCTPIKFLTKNAEKKKPIYYRVRSKNLNGNTVMLSFVKLRGVTSMTAISLLMRN